MMEKREPISLFAQIKQLEARVIALSEVVATQDATIKLLEAEVNSLTESVNN